MMKSPKDPKIWGPEDPKNPKSPLFLTLFPPQIRVFRGCFGAIGEELMGGGGLGENTQNLGFWGCKKSLKFGVLMAQKDPKFGILKTPKTPKFGVMETQKDPKLWDPEEPKNPKIWVHEEPKMGG